MMYTVNVAVCSEIRIKHNVKRAPCRTVEC